MTDEELLREHHHKALAGDWCSRCVGKYPCSTIRLLDKLEAAEAENTRLREALERIKNHPEGGSGWIQEVTGTAINSTEPTRHTLVSHAVAGQHVWMCEGCEIDREGP